MTQDRIQRRLAAILAADVVAYSRLMGQDEAGTLARLKAIQRELLDPKVAKYDGRIFKRTGDGVLIEFPSAVSAVEHAVEVQREMAERNRGLPEEIRIEFRVGINIGEVVVEGDDVFGDGVNVAARLEQIAEPGGICLSDDAFRQVQGKLDVAITDAGDQRLKNISRPVHVYRIDPSSKAPVAGPPRAPRKRKRLLSVPAIAAAGFSAAAVAAAGIWLLLGSDIGRQQAAPTMASAKPTTGHDFPIIAVLPFANQTGDQGQEYFADGVTEEVINALGRFNILRVIGRNAVLPYKTRPATREEIRSELGASYLVEGSVRRADHRVRIAVQLTEAQAGTVLWTNRYDGQMSDIFEFQDKIARQIAGKLATNITMVEGQRSRSRPNPNQDAYDLVLRARATGFTASRAANRRFRELMTKAIEMDGGYATAHALLAEAINAQVILGWAEFPDHELSRAEELARRAIALAPDEPDGHRALGRILVVRAEYRQAADELRRAIEINPSDVYALATWGSVQVFDGEVDGAIESLERAMQYDPRLEPLYVFDLAMSYYLAQRHEDAIRLAERGLSRYPDFAMFHASLAAAAARLNRSAQARRSAEMLRQRFPFLDLDVFGSRYKKEGHREYVREGLRLAGL